MRVVLFILFLAFTFNAGADKIKKGYQALEIYNYFEAKRLFEKSLKKKIVPASYGLSLIYFRNDNPFHNIDSAYRYIVIANEKFPILDEKQKLEFQIYGVDQVSLEHQRELVSGVLFRRAVKENSVEALENFIQKNYWSTRVDSASFIRDSLAFEIAANKNLSQSYMSFMETYPTSVFSEQANARYQQTLYLESTASNTLISYIDFVRKYPESPYRTDAEDKIFEIYTQTGTVQSFEKFIQDCPQNHNVNAAWKKLYNAHVQTTSYSENSMTEFMTEFPHYPFAEELEQEMKLANTIFYPFKSKEKWGFLDEFGEIRIYPQFEDAEDFQEGLAVIKLNGQYGYINKSGKIVIQPVYDDALSFNEGHAVVEYREKLGMINRNGEFIISPRFEDLGNLRNGLAYFLQDTLYGYFDSKGIERIPPKYTDAYDFEKGKAVVSQNGFFGLIDVFGTTFIPMKYEELKGYDQDIYLAKLNDFWGMIHISGDTILPFEYDYIGQMKNNRAIVEKESAFNYVTVHGVAVLQNWIPVYAEYRQLAEYKNGYAKIYTDGKYNLIDTTGKKLFAQPKENTGDYSLVIAASKGGKWGFVNAAGNQVIPYTFSFANSFKGNVAIVMADPFYGLINKSGQYIIQPFYEEMSIINDTLILAKSRGNFGLLNIQGDTLLNFVYINIEPISDKIVLIEGGGEMNYFDLKEQRLLRKEDE
ncbi:MAG: WG repeat-containing protein [Crocinitomicaceae bacterium]|nr:WG repeat-containing protein [Crocinitomicaceae bacterium]